MNRFERLAATIARHPGRALGAALAITLGLSFAAARLSIDADLSHLLPDGAPAADDYRTYLETFGGFEKVFVLVEAAPASKGASGSSVEEGALTDAAERIAEALRASPAARGARAGLEPTDEQFFLTRIAPRLPLLVPLDRAELEAKLAPEAIRARVAELERALSTPVGGMMAPLAAADPLGLSAGLLAAAPAGLPLDPVTGSFLSRDRSAALVVVTPARAEIDPAAGRELIAAIEQATRVAESDLDVDLDVRSIGGPIYAAHDESVFRRDLATTLSGSTFGVALILILGFEGLAIPFAIVVAVAAGVVWTIGLGALTFGRLTVVGLGFAAALLGLGVEYGIHGGSRFRAARLSGLGKTAALIVAFREAGPGVVSSALTSAVAMGALAVAHFRPLRELGLLLSVGVLTTLATMATLGAALFVLLGGRERGPSAGKTAAPLDANDHAARGRFAPFWRRFLGATVGVGSRSPRAVLAVAAALTLAALFGARALTVSVDPRALRPEDTPLAAVEAAAFEKFGLGLDTSTVVVTRKDLGAALDAAAIAREVMQQRLAPEAGGFGDVAIVAIDSPSDWIVTGSRSERRLAELAGLPWDDAADELETALAASGFRLDPFAPALAALRAFGRGEDPGAPPPEEWPDWMAELVRVGQESASVAVHARVAIGALDERASEDLALELARRVPGAALASTPRVGRELRQVATRDLLRSSVVAAVLVTIVVLVSLRGRLGASLLASLPLALGCLWTFGLWGAVGRPLDLVCVAALPVLFGTGIDLGVHALHGKPRGAIAAGLFESGIAMTLVTATAAVGFGSLSASRIPGLQNAGLLVAIGGTACLAATLYVLPALDALLSPQRSAR